MRKCRSRIEPRQCAAVRTGEAAHPDYRGRLAKRMRLLSSPTPRTRHDERVLVEALREALEAELPDAVALRHQLHADPEPSGAEFRTVARVAQAIGATPSVPVADTGRLIRIGSPDGGCIALRAELDALPVAQDVVTEAGGASGSYKHICGHDVHLAALTAVARAAASVQIPVPVLAILQPREERPPSGARDIVGAQLLQAHDVRAVIGAHVQPLVASGTVAATPGAVNAAADQFEIVLTGRGGHGGYPHLTRDPVLALAQVVLALQQLVSRRIDPMHSAVLSIGSLHAGTAANVIPDEARASGTLRVLDENDRMPAREELRGIVEHVARAFGCHGELRLHEGEPALVNDPVLTAHTHRWLGHMGFAVGSSLRSCGADDFSYYGAVAPSLMMFVGVGQDTDSPRPVTLHQHDFNPPDSAVRDVALALLAGYLAAVDLVSG